MSSSLDYSIPGVVASEVARRISMRDGEVAVLGLGRSGTAVSRLLRAAGMQVYASDMGDNAALRANAEALGAAGAALAVHALAAQFGTEPPALVVIACTIAGALAALSLQRYVIVIGTAFGGAWLLVMGALGLWHREAVTGLGSAATGWQAYPLRPAPGEGWVLIVWLVLAVAGLIAQFRLTTPRMAR